jgi:hypothetical protein
MNKTNLILSIVFSIMTCILIRDLINNLDSIIQHKLNYLVVLQVLEIVTYSCISIYFGSKVQRK